jgi:cytochrome c553
MRKLVGAQLRKAAGWIAVTMAGLAIGGLLFAWSGIYNIAASRGHWTVVEWFLQFGMKNSVKRRAWTIETPPLDDPDLYVLGAAHFHRACSHCHGAPGVKGDLTAQRALPPPPDLTHVSREWKDNELFWVVKHGIKYTGMPAWVALERDDEVWAIVAFLKKLPGIDGQEYRQLAIGTPDAPAQSGRDIARVGVTSEMVGACARCHGAEQRRPASGMVPVLHSQPREFLAAALRGYASGSRLSGIMQPVASELASDTIDKLADYYASLPAPTPRAVAGAVRIDGLATGGDPVARIPACTGCHDTSALPIYPRLAGQNAPYMANRLRLWKNGLPPWTPSEAVMAPIARLLSDEQIANLSAYFASLQPEHQAGRSP